MGGAITATDGGGGTAIITLLAPAYGQIGNDVGSTLAITQNVPLLIPATTNLVLSGFDRPSTGRLRYTGATTRWVSVTYALSWLPLTGNDFITYHFYLNGSPVSLYSAQETVFGTWGFSLSHTSLIQLATNDYIEIFVENTTAGTDIPFEKYILMAHTID